MCPSKAGHDTVRRLAQMQSRHMPALRKPRVLNRRNAHKILEIFQIDR